MFIKLAKFITDREKEFDLISDDRKVILRTISNYIQQKIDQKKVINLVYICIQNSRRSHFGQVASVLAAYHHNLTLHSYSGGTVVTAFNQNAINALQEIGFKIESDHNDPNPNYLVYFKEEKFTRCFSKLYNDPSMPADHFAAIMTCGEAEENCPFIPNAEFKTSTTYEDPKISDGTGRELQTYTERFAQILRETLFTFSLIRK